MATFPENLETIRTAVLGSNMRTAIHDAVEQAYDHGGEIMIDSELSDISENPVQNKVVKSAVDGKVDKITGKGLSTNDFTDALKDKLEHAQEELTFDDIPVEDSENPVKSGGVYTDTSITRNMIASIEEGETIPETYGVVWDYSNPSTVLTRIESAADFSNPEPATSLNGSGSSPFDNVYPWSEMKRYNIINGEVSYSQDDAGYIETLYDTVVYIPEFYYFAKKDTTNQKWTWSISPKAIEGYEKHPGSGRYVGRFHTSGSSSGVFSKGGVAPLANLTCANFRTYSHNKGNNWWQIDIATWSAIQMLYIVEFANWNIQDRLGKGNNTSSVKNTGATTGATYHTLKQTGAGGNMYRWIENPYSNMSIWLDGFIAVSREGYASINPIEYSDTVNNKKNVGVILPIVVYNGNKYIKSFGYSNEFPWMFIPDEIGGSANTYITDNTYNDPDIRLLYTGGDSSGADSHGLMVFNVGANVNYYKNNLSSRLIYIP